MSSKIKVDIIETVAGSGNITVSNPLSGSNIISTANITDNAVTMAKLPSALSFSGKTVSNFTNPNGYNLLVSRADSSNVNYASDTVILDFSSHINDYNTFWFSINIDAG